MICVSIANIEYPDLEKEISKYEMLELRLDLLNLSQQEYQKIFNLGKPIIVTWRYGKINDAVRIKALKQAILQGADYVDVEIDSKPEFVKEMMRFAKTNNCKVILSFHDFNQTPDIQTLRHIINKSIDLEGDYMKIACMANTNSDVARLLSLYEKNQNLIAFNMGDLGKISRLTSLYLGAEFTYVSMSKNNTTAPGQYTNEELRILLNKI